MRTLKKYIWQEAKLNKKIMFFWDYKVVDLFAKNDLLLSLSFNKSNITISQLHAFLTNKRLEQK